MQFAGVRTTVSDASSDDGEEYVCEVCGATFESPEARKDHLYSQGLVY